MDYKMGQIKEKIKNLDKYFWLVVLSYGMYIILEQSFLTMFSEWVFWGSCCGTLVIIMLLIYLFEKSIKFIKAIKISALIFLCVWNLIYLFARCNVNTHKPICAIVPLNGYYTRPGSGVLFSYKGYKFNRKVSIGKALSKYGEDLIHKCDIELSLYEVDGLPDFYYINYVDIVAK